MRVFGRDARLTSSDSEPPAKKTKKKKRVEEDRPGKTPRDQLITKPFSCVGHLVLLLTLQATAQELQDQGQEGSAQASAQEGRHIDLPSAVVVPVRS